ncbi:MAG: hypothetical protein DME17_02350 [Candidatus Rokuibacteriota bacterium]|nr:MAG: hypothetical protein DME17_02350 [Candidatus Rokubacteria bacterium]
MRKLLATLLTVAVAAAFVPTLSDAASSCPPEVAQAKELLTKQTQASRTLAGAREVQAPRMQDVQAPKMQDVQAPRSLAGAREIQAPRMQDVQAPKMQDVQAPRVSAKDVQAPRMQDVQAPKMQDVQAPRMQDVQAPKMQDVQAPKMQDVQAPRMQDVQAPRTLAGATQIDASKAAKLVKEAEAACKAGDMKTAKSKAAAAIARLK